MSLVTPNEGDLVLLPVTLGKSSDLGLPWRVQLYQNAYTPVQASTLADFTLCDFTGSDAVNLDASLWGSPTIISNRASSTYNSGTPVTWTNEGGSAQTAYGYVVANDNDVVIFAERFATSRTLNPGDQLELTLVFTGGTQT